MIDILTDLEKWVQAQERIALATVVSTWGSSPRGAGAKMALTPEGKITGSVSGGCVEGVVFEAGVEVLKTDRPELLHFGVADELAWEVGLACGGKIDVFVQSLDLQLFTQVAALVRSRTPAALVTVIGAKEELLGRQFLFTAEEPVYGTGQELLEAARDAARTGLTQGKSQRKFFPLESGEQVEFFVDVLLPSPALVIVGGVQAAIALASFAKILGYQTILIDPRKAFGNKERFPQVDLLIPLWPEDAFQQVPLTGRTCVVLLTHDPKIDDPALKIVLESPAFYIGALGSRSTHEKRRQRLLEQGVSLEGINRIHAPVGIDIGALTPEEIALAVMAEIVSSFRKPKS
jgi:xanthine dehydrogenase accessory factor